MLFKQNSQKVGTNILFIGLLTLLTSCNNSTALESFVAPDPQLTAKQVKSQQSSVSQTQTKDQTAQALELPSDFPASFPIYPDAKLQKVESGEAASGVITWNSPDNRQAIVNFYRKQLEASNWEITKPFNFNPQQSISTAIAIKNQQQVKLSLSKPTEDQNTKLSATYQSIETASKSNTQQVNKDNQPPETQVNNNVATSNGSFTDLNEVPDQLRQPLKSVAALGILTPYQGQNKTDVSKFAPNQVITRGEYANWLITANNRYYQDNSSKKIYLGSKNSQPAFSDVKANNPNFGAIQGLAETGLVPSALTEDSNNLLFRPDAPLTREDLVSWKVPLDTRSSLPQASIKALEESWGFQDAAEINSTALRALYADFQNGDRSNVRRIFGYTTIFQPKKPVTRAEAAVSLWYFGYQGDGITARELLNAK